MCEMCAITRIQEGAQTHELTKFEGQVMAMRSHEMEMRGGGHSGVQRSRTDRQLGVHCTRSEIFLREGANTKREASRIFLGMGDDERRLLERARWECGQPHEPSRGVSGP